MPPETLVPHKTLGKVQVKRAELIQAANQALLRMRPIAYRKELYPILVRLILVPLGILMAD